MTTLILFVIGVALLFAGSDSTTIGNKLDHVLSALGATLVI